MSTVYVDEGRSQAVEVMRLSVRQYHQMREAGVLDEDESVELLDGLLVHKDRGGPMPVSPLHALVTSRMLALAPELESRACHLRVQNPITIPPRHEPEPDAAIVRGRPDAYLDGHPGPSDALCVIEISDSSLERDRTTKQRIYAGAEIPSYIIVNLVEGRIELYTSPNATEGHYASVQILHRGDTVAIDLGGGTPLQVPVGAWLG